MRENLAKKRVKMAGNPYLATGFLRDTAHNPLDALDPDLQLHGGRAGATSHVRIWGPWYRPGHSPPAG